MIDMVTVVVYTGRINELVYSMTNPGTDSLTPTLLQLTQYFISYDVFIRLHC